jgi:serine protease Do
MSLFDDDFYSTKVRRQSRWQHDMFDRWNRQQKIGFALICTVAGAMLMVMFMLVAASVGVGQRNEVREASGPATEQDYMLWRNDLIVKAVEKVKPTVVSIISTVEDSETEQMRGVGIGSGVIFRKKGDVAYIVTNHHVIQAASKIGVVLANGDRREAKVTGKDSISDLAVIEVNGDGIETVAEFGDSEQLKTGETAIAIGNPLGLGFAQTTTVGVISSPHRKIPISFSNNGSYDWEMDVIQTDAAINQGNSGGALVNLAGQVIGINSMKVLEAGVEGLGFAIPINQVKETVESLIKYGKVKRPYMGVATDSLKSYKGTEALKLPESVKNGLIVIEAVGPAKEAGLATNDVIVELDGKPVSNNLMLRQYLYNEKKIGDTVKVTYYRNGKKETTTVKLAEKDEE